MDYLELSVKFKPRNPWTDILLAELAENGFESFVETENGLNAYAPVTEVSIENAVKKTILETDSNEFEAEWDTKIIPQQNWNAVWEADFQPVEVEDYLTILAPFHDQTNAKGLIVVIQPEMSFGTGHHQTTWMMSKALFELESVPENVLDMGTGTGVLAIISEKLGAKKILAIDIEDWSVENTKANAERNNCKNIRALCGDIDLIEQEKFGLILANINKNVLKSHMESYSKALEKGGLLLLSGFFESDVDELLEKAKLYDLSKVSVLTKDNWASIKLIKN